MWALMTTEQMIQWIDNASYEQLLTKWRFSPIGDPFFVGEVGEHFKNVMAKKRNELGNDEAAEASKRIGWEK
jgi:hypothetical protein